MEKKQPPVKEKSLCYFSLPVSDDRLTRKVIRQYGLTGYGALCKIYQEMAKEHGYYLPMDDDCITDYAEEWQWDEFPDFMEFILEIGLFDRQIYLETQILTNDMVKDRFLTAHKKSKSGNALRKDLLSRDNLEYVYFNVLEEESGKTVEKSKGETTQGKSVCRENPDMSGKSLFVGQKERIIDSQTELNDSLTDYLKNLSEDEKIVVKTYADCLGVSKPDLDDVQNLKQAVLHHGAERTLKAIQSVFEKDDNARTSTVLTELLFNNDNGRVVDR